MTKTKPEYYPINFSLDQLPTCCGIGVFCGFSQTPRYSGFGSKRKQEEPKFSTREEQAEDVIQRMNSRVGEDGYTTFIVSLVTRYEGSTEPTEWTVLAKMMEKYGWEAHHIFVNPNSGNEITMLSRHFPEMCAEMCAERAENGDWD